MIKINRHIKNMLIVPLFISSCAMSGCLESSFDLANESRLPESIPLPPGLKRADVSVTLNLYSTPGPDAEFILRDRKGKKLGEVKGYSKHPSYLPSYDAIVAVNGLSEIIALKPYSQNENMGQNGISVVALFYVIDDTCARKEGLEGGLPMCAKNEKNPKGLNSEGCPCLIDPENLAAASGGHR